MIGTDADNATSYPADVLRISEGWLRLGDYRPPQDTAGLVPLCCDCLAVPSGAGQLQPGSRWPTWEAALEARAVWTPKAARAAGRCVRCHAERESRLVGDTFGPIDPARFPDPAPDTDELRRQRQWAGSEPLPDTVAETWAGADELDSMERGFGDEVHYPVDALPPADYTSHKRHTDSSGEYARRQADTPKDGQRSTSLDAEPVRATFGDTNYYTPPVPLAEVERCEVVTSAGRCLVKAVRRVRLDGEKLHACDRHGKYVQRNGRLQRDRLNERNRAKYGTDYLTG